MGADEKNQSDVIAVSCVVCGIEATAIDIGEDGAEIGYCQEHAPEHLKPIVAAATEWMGPRGTRRFFRSRRH